MLPLRYAQRWRTASVVLLLLVLIAALMPALSFFPYRRQLVIWFIDLDKWSHGVTFVFLAVWFAGQYRPRSYWRIGVGLILFGVLIEVCQRMVTYRSAEWLDIAADAAGITAGLLIALAGLGGWSHRVESWFMRGRVDPDID